MRPRIKHKMLHSNTTKPEEYERLRWTIQQYKARTKDREKPPLEQSPIERHNSEMDTAVTNSMDSRDDNSEGSKFHKFDIIIIDFIKI